MNDLFVSGNVIGNNVYEIIKYNGLKYAMLDNLNYLNNHDFGFVHIFTKYTDTFFFELQKWLDTNKVKCIVLHQPVEYDSLIKFQRETKIPTIYVPHDTPDTMQAGGPIIWYWSMIGMFSDKLFGEFTNMLDRVGIGEEHRGMLGL